MFLFVQLWSFVATNIVYNNIPIYYYAGFIFITIVFPLIVMMIAKVLLEFLNLLHKNAELIRTINHILQVFPEAVLIQAFDDETKQMVIKFANNAAKKEILNWDQDIFGNENEEFNNKIIQDDNLIYVLTDVEHCSKTPQNSILLASEETITLSQLLRKHSNAIQNRETEVASTVQMQFKDKSVESKYFNIKTVKVKWESYKNSYIHMFMNTTHIKNYEKEKATNKALQLMFSSVSHEFRTPLNAFMNSMLLIENDYNSFIKNINSNLTECLKDKILNSKIIETDKKYFKIWKVSSAHLLSLVEDILDLAKIEAGTFILNNQPFKIKKLIEDISYIFEFQWTQKHLSFKVEVEDELKNSFFNSDIGRIKQILINLISNSLKFTQNGEIILKINKINSYLMKVQ